MIAYLNELAIQNPMHSSWDKFVQPMPPPMPQRDEELAYIKGHTVEVGPHFLLLCFLINHEAGEYLGYARLIYEGTIFAYDPTTNEAEWVPVCSSVKTLTPVEQVSVMHLSSMMQCVPTGGVVGSPAPPLGFRKFAEKCEIEEATSTMEEDLEEGEGVDTSPP